MKKTSRIISLLALVAVLVLALAACATGSVADSGTAKLVVEGASGYETYEVDLSKLEKRDEGAISLLEYVASLEGSSLYYNVQWGGGFGAYITSIGSLSPDASAKQYIAIYTSESEDFDVPSDFRPTVPTVEYEGATLTYSGVGLSSMHVKDGTVILFRLESY